MFKKFIHGPQHFIAWPCDRIQKNVYLAAHFQFHMNIEPGQDYLLDGKIVVKVLKAINRSKTVFSIEIPGTSIDTVEGVRLQEIKVEPDAGIEHN